MKKVLLFIIIIKYLTDLVPPKGSYLHEKFLEFSPELKLHETLPEHTAQRLLERKNGFRENLSDLIPSFLRSIK